jgi:hypothetical protein
MLHKYRGSDLPLIQNIQAEMNEIFSIPLGEIPD